MGQRNLDRKLSGMDESDVQNGDGGGEDGAVVSRPSII